MAPKKIRSETPTPTARRKNDSSQSLGESSAAPPQVPPELAPRKLGFVHRLVQAYLLPLLLLIPCPILVVVFAFVTCSPSVTPTFEGLWTYGAKHGAAALVIDSFTFVGVGDLKAWTFLAVFNFVALLIYWWPGPEKCGPITPTGHTPKYMDNGLTHCILFVSMFLAGAGFGWYDLGIIYDNFPKMTGALNAFGLVFCVLLYCKGLWYPSTADAGSSGNGCIFDYYWGTELYPNIFGVDVKKFVNCRFSMTFWQLAGISYAWKSYTSHGVLDAGLVLSALSQFLYLFKFFAWEIGYMRSIDIIVDRAGFMETWGVISWVPAVYTLHTRILVRSPSGLSWPTALAIFAVGFAGIVCNYWADWQRMNFREKKGDVKVWGKSPVSIKAKYLAKNTATGQVETHESLLLASGWWGLARHFQYVFELTAAWSWGLLAGVQTNGVLPLFYPMFLTILLVHRAIRDEEKCLVKYGEYYKEYMKLVPYKMVPYVF